MVTKFCMVVQSIVDSQYGTSFMSPLVPRILRHCLDFWKICTTLLQTKQTYYNFCSPPDHCLRPQSLIYQPNKYNTSDIKNIQVMWDITSFKLANSCQFT